MQFKKILSPPSLFFSARGAVSLHPSCLVSSPPARFLILRDKSRNSRYPLTPLVPADPLLLVPSSTARSQPFT